MPFMEILFSAISALTPSFQPDKYAANARYYIFYGHISSMLNLMTKKETRYVRSSFDHLLSGRRM